VSDSDEVLLAPLEEADARARELLRPRLELPMRLVVETYGFLGLLASRILATRIQTAARKVVAKLTMRVSNDLYCMATLAARGFPLQAATLGASAVEGALAAAFIRESEGRASKWIEHSDRRHSFESVPTMISDVIGDVRAHETGSLAYQIYRELCMPKHTNPLVELRVGAEWRDDGVEFRNGLDLTENAIKVSFFALQ